MEHVAEEADSLKDSLDKYFQRHQRRMQEVQERDALLGRAVRSCLSLQIYMIYALFFGISNLSSNALTIIL